MVPARHTLAVPIGRNVPAVLGRRLDPSFAPEVRANVTAVTVGRLVANGAYRFSGPFLGVIARGMHVTLGQLGVAMAVAELSGLAGPITGRVVDRVGSTRAMWAGLAGVAGGAVLAAASTSPAWFAASLFLLAWSKSVYDIGLGTWIADRVAYERRSRIVGLTETSWALGLLLGVSALGLVTAVANFRAAFVVVAAAALGLSAVLRARLGRGEPAHLRSVVADGRGSLDGSGRLMVLGMLVMAAAAQSLFVTFGSWLEDAHGFTSSGLAAVTFGLGGFELCASLTSAHRTDHWGKERSAAAGTALMAPGAVLLAIGHDHLAVGLVGVVLAIGMFEFAIVSSIAIGSTLVPGSPARGLAWMVASTTVGRGLVSVPATRLYQRHGIVAPASITAVLASVAAICFVTRARWIHQRGTMPAGTAAQR